MYFGKNIIDKGNFTKKESLLEMKEQNSRVNANTCSFQKA